MLEQVHFQNIKALADVRVDLAPLTVIVGPNGCGKSTLLDQIGFLCEVSQAEQLSPGVPRWRTLTENGAAPPPTAGSTGLRVWNGKSGNIQLTLSFGKAGSNQLVTWANNVKVGHSSHSSPAVKPEQEEYLRRYFSWRALRLTLHPQAMRASSPLVEDPSTLSATGEGLPSLLAHIKLNDEERLKAIEADLKIVVPHFERLHFDVEKPNRYALSLSLRGAGKVPATQVSDGTLLALGLLTAVHWGELPDIVLLDDLDHGLHLGGQVRLLKAIRVVMAQRPTLQVIATSHSPYLLDELKAEEVRIMGLTREGHAVVKPLTAHPDYAQLSKALRAGELWATLGEDWVAEGSGG